jgi:RES domain-containing protein
VRLYRARAWRGRGKATFDPLDSSGSVGGPMGWRYNDLSTEILYTAEVEALAVLEVAVRPGFDTIRQILVGAIDVPDGSIVDLPDLDIVLPSNWNTRPVADDSRTIAREFLDAIAAMPTGKPKPVGVRVPSVLSESDYNVLLDPSRKGEYTSAISNRIPFEYLRVTGS